VRIPCVHPRNRHPQSLNSLPAQAGHYANYFVRNSGARAADISFVNPDLPDRNCDLQLNEETTSRFAHIFPPTNPEILKRSGSAEKTSLA
jgi:hypothetical protein